MLARYVTLPVKAVIAEDEWYASESRKIDVLVPDDQPEATGLLDADGHMLYRVVSRGPLGFCR